MTLGGRAVYEHDYGYPQHDHLHCTMCDTLIEFQSDELQRIRDAVGREHRFRVTGHRLIVTGVCPSTAASSLSRHTHSASTSRKNPHHPLVIPRVPHHAKSLRVLCVSALRAMLESRYIQFRGSCASSEGRLRGPQRGDRRT